MGRLSLFDHALLLGFEEVIKRHFYIKRKEIIEECEKWLEFAEKR